MYGVFYVWQHYYSQGENEHTLCKIYETAEECEKYISGDDRYYMILKLEPGLNIQRLVDAAVRNKRIDYDYISP